MEFQCLTPFQYHFKYPAADVEHYKELCGEYEQFCSSSSSSSSHNVSDYYSNCSVSLLCISCIDVLLWLLLPLQHSDDDDDDDGNHRQHHKLHSSKDSSILSSEFSDTDYLLLPATLSFHPTQEGALLTGLISDTNCDDVKFKLSPAFALYFIAKHHLSLQYQPGLHGGERKKHLLVMMKSSISLIKRAVKVGTVVTCYCIIHTQL